MSSRRKKIARPQRIGRWPRTNTIWSSARMSCITSCGMIRSRDAYERVREDRPAERARPRDRLDRVGAALLGNELRCLEMADGGKGHPVHVVEPLRAGVPAPDLIE